MVRLDFSRGRNPRKALFHKSFSCTEPFFGFTSPLTSGKIKIRDCFLRGLISYGKTLWKIQISNVGAVITTEMFNKGFLGPTKNNQPFSKRLVTLPR